MKSSKTSFLRNCIRWNVRLEKSWFDIWWIGKVDVPLHSQLKRTGFRKCLSLLSGEQVLLVSVTLAHLYIIGVRRTSEALEKKLLRKFGGFKKLSYLCIRNSKERVVGSVRYMVGAWWR